MCGSFRHYDEMLALRAVLLASGASCEWPTIDHRRDLSTQRTLSANGPDFPGLTRRVMGPVWLRFRRPRSVLGRNLSRQVPAFPAE